ncbi:MAG: ABC transporter permease [Spirochaetes bacterium]|nr:ABC transporter permease [Spirochaetota bacterium]
MKALLKRALLAVPLLLGAALVIHTLIYLIPGDPAAMISGDYASAADIAAIRRELSLDEPFLHRFLTYLGKLAVLDMGKSIYTGLPVTTLIARRFPATLLLAAVSMALAAAAGIGLGVLAAARRGRRADTAVLWISSFFISTPVFVTCFILALVFSHWLNLLPPSGRQGLNPAYIILPAAALASRSLALIIRVVRNELIEVLKSNYIKASRALGIPEWRVVLVYGLRNVMVPAITIILLDFGAYLGGAVVTETVFSWPGIGRLLIMALQKRDLPLVQGILIFGTALFLLIGMMIELLQARQPKAGT